VLFKILTGKNFRPCTYEIFLYIVFLQVIVSSLLPDLLIADSVWSDSYNKALSKQRAWA